MKATKKPPKAPPSLAMQAVLYTRYGSPNVLRLTQVERPVPDDGQVLVKVHAACLNAADRYTVRGRPLLARLLLGNGLRRPKDRRLGLNFGGRVEAVGANVTRWHVGAEIYGSALGSLSKGVVE